MSNESESETELIKIMTHLINDTDPKPDPEFEYYCDSPVTVILEPAIIVPPINFIELLENIIKYEIIKSDYTNLDELAIEYISSLIKNNPAYLISIEQLFTDIVINDIISISKIPNMISLLVQLYTILCPFKNGYRVGELCGPILKFIFSVIIQEKIVCVSNESELLLFLYSLIDSCVGLIMIQHNNKNTEKLGKWGKWRKWRNLFGFECLSNRHF